MKEFISKHIIACSIFIFVVIWFFFGRPAQIGAGSSNIQPLYSDPDRFGSVRTPSVWAFNYKGAQYLIAAGAGGGVAIIPISEPHTIDINVTGDGLITRKVQGTITKRQ